MNEPVWLVPESTLKKLIDEAIQLGNDIGLHKPTNALALNLAADACRQCQAAAASDTMMEVLIELKAKAARLNAKEVSLTFGKAETIAGWDFRVSIAAPGILHKEENDDE